MLSWRALPLGFASAVLLVLVPVQCQSADVLAETGQTATFSWTLPDLSGVTVLVVFNASDPSKAIGLIVSTNGIFGTPSFDSRFVYLGDTRQRNMTFTLSDVRGWDAGWYKCGKNGISNELPNCGQRLVVLGFPSTPLIMSPDGPVKEGDDVTLICQTTSKSLPPDHGLTLTYTWTRDGVRMSGENDRHLVVRNIRRTERERQYACSATESRGLTSQISNSYVIDVQYPPHVTVTSDPHLQPDGSVRVTEDVDTVRLTCSASGNPAPTSLSWSPQGGQGGQLTFDPVRRQHQGVHTCTAVAHSAKFGNLSSTASVSILLRHPPQAPHLLSVTSGVTSPVVEAVWRQETEVGGAAYFLLELREDGGQWKNTSRNVTEAAFPGNDVYSVLLENLDPGKTYDVRLRAYNAYGRSPYSNESRFTVGQGVQCPERVEGAGGSLGTGPSLAVGLGLGLALASGLAALLYWRLLRHRGSHKETADSPGEPGSQYEGLDVTTRHQPSPSDVTYQDIHLYENPRGPTRQDESEHVYEDAATT